MGSLVAEIYMESRFELNCGRFAPLTWQTSFGAFGCPGRKRLYIQLMKSQADPDSVYSGVFEMEMQR